MHSTDSTFIIVGGGIAGLCAAIGLAKVGIEAHVCESAIELKGIGAGFGLAANAMQALEHLGLKDEIVPIGHYLASYNVLDQKEIFLLNQTRVNQSKISTGQFRYPSGRSASVSLIQIPNGQVHLGKRAVSFERREKIFKFISQTEAMYAAKPF
jgi:2-polyprenyl-6-methoxyphenol hydroxylase-like FAD-dependent oxidoreductase